ncbi:lymphocyte activation gene 3 protein [Eleutherodactylus coqui]|uniref:lymphocyte activation gene 3 protein n=1 Tax=Eleutherodactylus coqui TaxID=57060 RepID=UPI0034618714
MYVEPVCFLLLCTIIPVSAVRVTGVLGGHVILPCTMTKELVKAGRQSPYAASSVQWQIKDSTPRPVLNLRPGGITFTSHLAKSRASVPPSMSDQGIFSLHLKDLTEEDAGRYFAVGKYGRSTQECLVTLRIIKVMQFPQGPLPPKSSVNLTCRIVDPDGSSTSVHWLHDGILVQPSSRISMNGSSLYLHSLTQEDHGKWSCEVNGARSSVTLLVVGIAGPDPLLLYTAMGSSVQLPCNVMHLPVERQLSFHWSKDSKSIPSNKQVLFLNYVRPEDAGTYRCESTYKSQQLNRRIELKVIQVSSSGPEFTREGSQLQLLCNISGSTGKEKFQWTGPSLTDGQKYVINGALVNLRDVHIQDSGMWTCSVYRMNEVLGKVEHWVNVHAAQTADVGVFTSWHVFLTLMLILVFSLAVIAIISFRNHKRRLSHLKALTSVEILTVSQPKKLSVSE